MANKRVVYHEPAQKLVALFRKRHEELAVELERNFEEIFFTSDPRAHPELVGNAWRYTSIENAKDINKVRSDPGFYIILSDYPVGDNQCRFDFLGLPAIYRGHNTKIRERVMSHLDNWSYRKMKTDRTTPQIPLESCLKLGDAHDKKNGGVNIEQAPWANYRWSVLTLSMPGSNEFIRNQSEAGFDRAFGRPKRNENEKTHRYKGSADTLISTLQGVEAVDE